MSEHTKLPKLVLGHIEVVAHDGESGIPYDEAVIHLEGDENSEIEVHCPGALSLAPFIVKAVNNHAALIDALKGIQTYSSDPVAVNAARAALARAGDGT